MHFKIFLAFSALVFIIVGFSLYRAPGIGEALMVGFILTFVGFLQFLKFKEVPKSEVDPKRQATLDQIEVLRLEKELNALMLDKAKIVNHMEGIKNENKKFVF
jgi:hypothetical protein